MVMKWKFKMGQSGLNLASVFFVLTFCLIVQELILRNPRLLPKTTGQLNSWNLLQPWRSLTLLLSYCFEWSKLRTGFGGFVRRTGCTIVFVFLPAD